MKRQIRIIMGLMALIFGTSVSLFSTSAQAAPTTVPYVDLSKYVGDWYQIAHIPLFFEGGNCDCARQRLTAGASGVVQVYNSCNRGGPSGKLDSISGEAYNDDLKSNSKFTVDFNVFIKGTYWIVGLDSQYRYAVVTDKYSYSLYILSKTPTLSADLYQEAVDIASAKSLGVEDLVMTNQTNCQYPK